MKYLFCLVLLFFCGGCQNSPSKLQSWMEPSGKPKVLCTTAIIADIVGQIGQDRIDHLALIDGAMDPHSYELVKGDAEKLSYAQVIFYNGLGLEHGASLRRQIEEHPKAVALGEHIREKKSEAVIYDRGQLDPHIWLDVSLWAEIVDPIIEALSDLDPQNALFFQESGKKVKQDLLTLDTALAQKIQKVPSQKRYLVTSHDAFNYFTRRYLNDGTNWKERFCAPEGLAPDGQLSCRDIQLVIDYLTAHQVPVIFPESNISQDSLKKVVSVCKEKGMHVIIAPALLYSDTLGSSSNYQAMMEHNVETLTGAWQ